MTSFLFDYLLGHSLLWNCCYARMLRTHLLSNHTGRLSSVVRAGGSGSVPAAESELTAPPSTGAQKVGKQGERCLSGAVER